MNLHHSVDWKGLTFLGKVLLAAMVGSGGIYFSLLYASESRARDAGAPSIVLIQEMRPAPPQSLSLSLSTTTSMRVINTLTIADAVPARGKFIAADMTTMILTLYEDGVAVAKYPIIARGGPDSPYGVPAGFYAVLEKEPERLDIAERVYQPWSVRFSGNYALHGVPYRGDGSPADSSDDSLRLNTDDAERVYDFADAGTGIFVYDPPAARPPSLSLDALSAPEISAGAYLVADIDTGDVLLERRASDALPLTSLTALLTALVANETLPADTRPSEVRKAMFAAGFTGWMNAKARALDMASTHFSDTSSTSTENVSTATDVFHLAAYLARYKTFILEDARTAAARGSMVSVVSVPVDGAVRRAAIIILQSKDARTDASALASWFTKSVELGAETAATACATCAPPPVYRKIQL